MSIEIKKKEGESVNALIYRFTKKTQQSGVLREAKKRRYHKREVPRIKRRLSALHRAKKREQFLKDKKSGLI